MESYYWKESKKIIDFDLCSIILVVVWEDIINWNIIVIIYVRDNKVFCVIIVVGDVVNSVEFFKYFEDRVKGFVDELDIDYEF